MSVRLNLPAAAIATFLICIAPLKCHSAEIDPDLLETLQADYRSYGLPFPPKEADLLKRKHHKGSSNGMQDYYFDLAFRVKTNGKEQHWIGLRKADREGAYFGVISKPDSNLVSQTSKTRPPYQSGFYLDPDLALSVQCHARGWHELAANLLRRSRRSVQFADFGDDLIRRPSDDREALAQLAWNYWCNEFIRPEADREAVIRRLKKLVDTPFGFDTVAHQNIIADMQATLKPVRPASKTETVIQKLLAGKTNERWKAKKEMSQLGLKAVPDLILHIDDFRMTHTIDSNWRGAWHVRVADLVLEYLNELKGANNDFRSNFFNSPDSFAYDFLIAEGRGRRADARHVLHWWAEFQASTPVDFYRLHSIVQSGGKYEVNGTLLKHFGHQHPDEFLPYLEEFISKVTGNRSLFEALAASAVESKEKARILVAETTHQNRTHRACAIEQLINLNHLQGLPLILQEIKAIPNEPEDPYWIADTKSVIRVAGNINDNEVWAACHQRLQQISVGHRLELMQVLRFRNKQRQRAIKLLASFLNDDNIRKIPRRIQNGKLADVGLYEGPCAGFIWDEITVKDYAAELLSGLLKVNSDDLSDVRTKEEWKILRQRVQHALIANSEKKD